MNSLSKIKALILDMDGVLWRGGEALGDLPAIFEKIASRGLKVVLATNNSTRTPRAHFDKLASFGVQLSPDQIITSSMAVGALLRDHFPQGGSVYAVGMEGVFDALEKAGFRTYRDGEHPAKVDAVVAGMDQAFTYEKVANAARLIRKDAPFYATNPDKTFPTPQGLMPGAGTLLAAIEAASDVAPIVAGKPKAYLFQLAMRRMGVMPGETLMIGDRLETDILGGQNAGCKTALVLSGVSTREEGEAWQPKVDLIAENLSEIIF